MVRKKLFIFDLDGTLVDAYRAIERSLNHTLKNFSYPEVAYRAVKRSVGRGDEAFINNFFPLKQRKKALDIYRRHHQESVLRHSRLMVNARGLLSALKKKNKMVAIASNRPQEFTNKIVNKLNIDSYFNWVLCADTVGSLKPDPKIINTIVDRFGVARKHTVYIGDMDIDLETAKRAKVDAVFIKGGSSNPDQVKKYKNKTTVSSLKEVLALYD